MNIVQRMLLLLFNNSITEPLPFEKDRKILLLQGFLQNSFIVLTSTTYLSGLAILLNFDENIVALIPLLLTICGAFSILFSFYWERLEAWKSKIIILQLSGNLLVCLAAFLALILPANIRYYFFIVLLVAGSISSVSVWNAFTPWFVSLVPQSIRAQYFSNRQIVGVIPAIVFPVFVGRLLDKTYDQKIGFYIIYSVATLVAVLNAYSLIKITPPPKNCMKTKIKFSDLFFVPLKNYQYRQYLSDMILIFSSIYFSFSFIAVYMIKYIEASFSFISVIATICALISIILYRIWGRICRVIGSTKVMGFSVLLFALSMLLNFGINSTTFKYVYTLASILNAMANTGFLVSTFDRRYTIMPVDSQSIYEGIYVSVTGLAILAGVLSGSWVKNILADNSIMYGVEHGQIRFLFLLSSLLLMVATLKIFIQEKENAKRIIRDRD
jgi:Na+/melibiose symporter-like transporter